MKERAGHKKVEFSNQKELQKVKARLIQRPAEADGIENELFHVSELALIFSPIYKIKFRKRSTGNERTIMIDGVTAKVTGSQ